MDAAERLLPILAVEMEGRGDDMAWPLIADLQDIFAQIGLNRGDAVLFQVFVDAQLLADHRLALGDGLRPRLLANRQHRRAGLIGGGAPMDMATGLLHPGGEFLQVEIQIGQGVVLDVAADIAQRLEFRQPGHGGGALDLKALLGPAQRLCSPGSTSASAARCLNWGNGSA